MKINLYRRELVSTIIVIMIISLNANSEDNKSPTFETDIRPIIERRCLPCHKNKFFARGGYRMVSLEMVIRGGKSGPAIVAGRPEDSRIVKRITLDPRNSKRMPPPDSADSLSATDIDLISDWIRQGAK